MGKRNDLRSTALVQIYNHIVHNDGASYSDMLANAMEPEYKIIVEQVARVDYHVGQLLMNSFIDDNTSPELKRILLTSLCTVCLGYSKSHPTATAEFFQRLPEACCKVVGEGFESLRSTFLYTGTPEIILNEANASVCSLSQAPVLGSAVNMSKLFAKVNCSVVDIVSSALSILNKTQVDNKEEATSSGRLLLEFQKQIQTDANSNDATATQTSRDEDALRNLLKAMVSRHWIPNKAGYDPDGSLLSVVNLKDYDPKIIDVLCDWSSQMLRRERKEDMLFPSSFFGDLLLCLAVASSHTPAAFCNRIQDKYPDLPKSIAAVARSQTSFPARQAALLVLSNLGNLSLEVAQSLLVCLQESILVSGIAQKSVQRFTRADTEALQFLCNGLNSGSALQSAMICRLLSTLANNKKLSLQQRSLVIDRVNAFAADLTEDKPIILFRPDTKMFEHPSLAAVVGEAVNATWGIEFDESLSVPFQLGQADGEALYTCRVHESPPVWYRYYKTLNCWYWTLYQDNSCWMSTSTLTVKKGIWAGKMPDATNQHCIRYLHHVNPVPPSDVLDINADWLPVE